MGTITKDLGAVTAYAYAVEGGYTGTEEEFEALLGNIAEDLGNIENLTVTVTTLSPGSSATASYADGVLSLGIPQGEKGDEGDPGAQGVGIGSVSKTGTSGNVDTYTIYSDETTPSSLGTFTVTNSNVSSVAGKTGAVTLGAGDVGYDASQTYSTDTVGEAITNVKSQIDEVYSDKTFTLSGASAQVYPYTFVPNKTYYVSNKTVGTSPGVRTCDASGSETIEWIKNGLAYGETVAFFPTKNASYFRIYSANGDCDIEIATNGAVLDNVDSAISAVDEKTDRLNEMLGNVTKYKNWERYRKPQGFSADIPIGIYTDGHSYITDYNKENYKNAGGNTYYISPNGSNGYDGSRNTPWRSPYTAFTRASSGDTIVFLEGDYDRNTTDMATGIVTKSLNIIGEGKVRIFNGDWCTFTAVNGYNNVYKTTRSLGAVAYEVDSVGDEILLMTLVDSIANVEATVGSYYKDGNDFYVHPQKAGTPNAGGAKIFITVDYVDFLSFDNSNQNVKAYIENITMIGSTKSFRFYRSSTSNTLDVCMDHVNLMWCGYDSRNAVEVFGGNAVFNECKIFGSYRDGFNYNGTDTSGITYRDNMIVEINCEASNCGIGRTEVNMNGSTAHRNSKVVRVNCTYHDNHGPNCADVQEDTESVSLGCIAYNSTADADAANVNFECATDGAKMWLENCIGVGAHVDFYCPSEASMYMSKCSYDTKSGDGITETDAVPPIVWMLRNYDTSEQILRH